MSEMMTIAKTEFANLEERARKLAADKSFLQLTIHLMNKLSAVSGLDNVIEDMLRSVSDVIGGTNLILYHRIDNAIYYADVYGTKKTLAEVDDPRVKTAWETREPAEYEHDFSDTQMMTPEFSKAYTWIFPLLVGPDLIGVFKMESLHISMRELSQQLPTFFSYAAHVLKNEILGHTRLKHAYDDLAQEMTVRKQAEEELRLVNESLEERVVARTAELQTANEQLRENEKQIKFLLDQSEQSRRALLSILEDEKRVEAALRESEGHIKQLIEASPVAMLVSSGIDEQVVLVNKKFGELFGYTIEDMPDVAHWWSLAYPDEKYREKVRTLWAARAEYAIRDKTQIEPMEATVTCKDGDIRSIEFQLSSIGEKNLVVFNDLTGRKYAEQALHEREKHSQALLRLSRNLERAQTYEQVLNAARDEVRNIIGYQNLWAYLLTEDKKYAHSLVAGGPTSDTVMSEEGAATLTIQGDRMLEEIAEAKEIVVVEDAQTDERVNKEIVAKMGNRTIVNVPILLFDRHMGAVGTGTFGDEGVRIPTKPEQEFLMALANHMAVALDRIHLLTERKRAEEALRRLNRELQALSNCNQVLMRAVDEQTLLSEICHIICDQAGYRMAWVGYAEHDDVKTVRPVAWAGFEDGYLASANITWADTERGRGPSGTAIRSGESACIKDYTTDPQAAPWRENALQRGYRSCITLPLKDENAKTFGVLNIYSTELNAFTPDEMRLLEQLAGDLAFGIGVLHARTERRRAEEALRQEHQNYVTLVNSIDGIVWEADAQTFAFNFVSHQAERLLGYPIERWLAEPTFWKDHLHPDDQEWAVNFCMQAVREKRPHDFEYRMLAADGRVVWLRDIVTIVVVNDQPVRLRGIMLDIAERRRAEEALRESEQKLRTIFNTMEEALSLNELIMDDRGEIIDYKILEVNPAFEKDTELTREQAIGRTATEMYGMSSEYINAFWKAHLHDEHAVKTDMFVDQAKTWKHISTSIPVNNKFVVSFFDITELKNAENALRESEEVYRKLVAASPDAITGTDLAGQITLVSPKAIEMFGLSPDDNVLEHSIFDWVAPEDMERAAANMQHLLTTGQMRYREFVLRKKDGTYFDGEVNAALIQAADGTPKGAIIITRDITERKRAENALRESEQKFRSFVEESSEGVTLVDEQGTIIEWNRAREQMTRLPATQVIGKAFWDVQYQMILPELRTPEHHERNKQIVLDALQTGQSPIFGDYSGVIARSVFCDEAIPAQQFRNDNVGDCFANAFGGSQ